MTRTEAARQYARAMGELVTANVMLTRYPQSPSIKEDARRAERELAEAIQVLTGPTRHPLDLSTRCAACGQALEWKRDALGMRETAVHICTAA